MSSHEFSSPSQLSNCQLNDTCDSANWPFLPNYLLTTMTFECLYNNPWVSSTIGSIIIGLSGIFPLLVIPVEEGVSLKSGAGAKTLKVLLSFAVGCLLGDVFLHLLPEVWQIHENESSDSAIHPGMVKGLWVISGLLIFVFLEKAFTFSFETSDTVVPENTKAVNLSYKEVNGNVSNGCMVSENNNVKEVYNKRDKDQDYLIEQYSQIKAKKAKNLSVKRKDVKTKTGTKPSSSIHVSGYLNLMANSFDNFSHGLAVGGSFLVSFPSGVFTTLAILLHEIPHEVGDFAILLKSGFSRWDAAKAQMCTATAGLLGSFAAISLSGAADSVEARTSWILPFTAGGFLHIALVTVLPDLMKEDNPKESFLQMLSLFTGICVMALLSMYAE